MNIALFEDAGYLNLLPLTWLRATFELRCGMDRLLDKVRTHAGPHVARVWVREVLRPVVEERIELDPADPAADWCLLNGRALLTERLTPPPVGVAWQSNGCIVAAGVRPADLEELTLEMFFDEGALRTWFEDQDYRLLPAPESVRLVSYPWQLPLENSEELKRQCRAGGIHEGRVYPGAHLLNPEQIHIAAGARIKPGVVLDAEEGPIHIDRDAEIQPNAVLVGPCYVGPKCLVRPGAVLREGTSLGPVCKVGGEVEASIFHGYANKQHDGFLGHSYVAEWVNLGADTVTSDLKNTYGAIRVYLNGVGVESGQHFVGATIGDHSKTGIGTILPTGCVVGVASNVFTSSAVPKFVPSFAWLTEAGMTNYRLEKAIHIARIVMARRDVYLSDAEVTLLQRTAELARNVEAAGWE